MKRQFVVWCPEDDEAEEDGLPIEAFDFDMAATTWAERDDHLSADYRIVGGTDVTVTVKDVKSGRVATFRVSGEAVPSYYARAIGDVPDLDNPNL